MNLFRSLDSGYSKFKVQFEFSCRGKKMLYFLSKRYCSGGRLTVHNGAIYDDKKWQCYVWGINLMDDVHTVIT